MIFQNKLLKHKIRNKADITFVRAEYAILKTL